MKLIRNYFKKNLQYRRLLILSLGLAIVNQVFSLLSPQIMRIFMDQYATKIELFTQETFIAGVIKRTLIAIAAAGISRTAKTFQDYYVNLMSQTIGSRMYAQGVSHAFSLPYSVFENRQSGSLLDKLFKARNDIQNLLNSLINTVFLTGIGMLMVMVYAFWVHWIIGALFAIMVPILARTTVRISRNIKGSQQQIVKKSAELSGSTIENIKNVSIIKSLGLEDQEVKHLNSVNEQLIALEIDKLKIIKTLTFTQGTLINGLRNILQAVMLRMIFRGYISVGEFFSLLFYSFLIFNPLYALPEVAKHIQEARASAETLEEIFKLEKEQHTNKGIQIDHIETLDCQEVSFSYDQTPALRNITRSLQAGQTLAFVGPSGSGKSTMIKMITGLYQPNQGEIRINDVHAHDIARTSVKKNIGIVSQDTQLFTGSVRDNLHFVKPDASDQECRSVLQSAQLEDFVQQHPDGLSARIGEGGLKLSGGQKQRLAIARALIRDPDLLIFDEATSALDSLIEAEITQTIRAISQSSKTLMTIVVAHRLSTIMHADHIIVIEDGQISEEGKHADLLTKKGLYYAMRRQQVGQTLNQS